jgi:hypothetical protein
MFSATMPKNIQSLAAKALSKPVTITISGRFMVAAEITQIDKIVSNGYDQKVHQLMLDLGRIFSDDENSRVLVFTSSGEDLQGAVLRNEHHPWCHRPDRSEQSSQSGICAHFLVVHPSTSGCAAPNSSASTSVAKDAGASMSNFWTATTRRFEPRGCASASSISSRMTTSDGGSSSPRFSASASLRTSSTQTSSSQ